MKIGPGRPVLSRILEALRSDESDDRADRISRFWSILGAHNFAGLQVHHLYRDVPKGAAHHQHLPANVDARQQAVLVKPGGWQRLLTYRQPVGFRHLLRYLLAGHRI